MRSWIAALGLAALVPSASAQAAAGRVDWPTFFRVGPSRHYLVVDELFRGTILDVKSCTDQWCQVQYGRVIGYVERAALNVDPFPPSKGRGGAAIASTARGVATGKASCCGSAAGSRVIPARTPCCPGVANRQARR